MSAGATPRPTPAVDLNRLIEKSQQALVDAQRVATRAGHAEADGEHLLLGLLDQPDGSADALLTGCGADTADLRAQVRADLDRRPRVTGPGLAHGQQRPGVSPGPVAITSRLARVLDAAEREAARLKDEYVSVEHLSTRRCCSGR
jgi:ATP-dependent Clp protease ATP-binding subunit ClpB